MYHNFFVHSSVNGYLGCFHVLAIVNSAGTDIGAHASLSIMVFSGYMPSSGIVGSYGSICREGMETQNTENGFVDTAGDGESGTSGGGSIDI